MVLLEQESDKRVKVEKKNAGGSVPLILAGGKAETGKSLYVPGLYIKF